MPKMTLEQRVIRYLEQKRGSKRELGRSHYIQMSHEELNTHYFIGRNGAVRKGRCASNSDSITDTIHKRMIIWEQEQGL